MTNKSVKSRIEKIEDLYYQLESLVKAERMDYDILFKGIIKIVEQYINFDPILPDKISTLLTKTYLQVFHAIRYYAKGHNFEDIYKQYNVHITHLATNLDLAEITADLSFILWMMNKLDLAIKEGKKSIEILEKLGNTSTLTGRYSNVGYIYECSGDLDKAFQYYQLGMQYGMKIQNEEVLSLAYSGLGRISAMRGKLKQAIHFFLEAKKRIHDENSDNYFSICNNLGIAYGSIGQYQDALTYLEPFLTSEMESNDPDTFIAIAINSANCYRVLTEVDKAEELLQRALSCANTLNYYNDMASIMINIGNIKIKQKQYNSAYKWFTKANKASFKTNDKLHKLGILQGLGLTYKGLQDYSMSLNALSKAQPLAEELQLLDKLAENHAILSQVYELQGNIQAAYDHYKKSMEYEMKVKNEAYNQEIQALKQEYEKPNLNGKALINYTSTSLISQELQKMVKIPLIGCNSLMQNVIHQALMVANNDGLSVLIIGETGSGKEAIARLIHYASLRKENSFISVNSAAFTTSLIESAFFGSEKGAFTGAASQTLGYFEAANNGTLFLDEIGDMPLKMQSKFLRVIEEKIIHRVGSTKDIRVDFRLISATNKDLSTMALSNEFRFDLLNRINVMELYLPPLRERQDDIPLLVDYYLQAISANQGRSTPIITKEALDLLANYQYPGNIRELKNILQRSLILCHDSVLDVDAINIQQAPCAICDNYPDLPSLKLDECEEWIINRALSMSNGIQKKAAELLGITSYSLSRKLKKFRERKD